MSTLETIVNSAQPQATPADVSSRRYVAFISYSHDDRKLARWLHRSIESYRIPQAIRHKVGRSKPDSDRLVPVFMDREELSTSADLAETIRNALHQSQFLIVICSPSAARSKWVNEEIRVFKSLGGAARILCLIASGVPGASDGHVAPELECFPAALRFHVEAGQITDRPAPEPMGADARSGTESRRDAKLKLIAGLLSVNLDELRQRDQNRRQRRLALVSAAATVGCVVLAVLASVAWFARNEAEQQRRLAVQQSLTAERTADFLISLFKVSDPGEARGNSVTAREILDKGALQINQSLVNEPQVRAKLSATLGEVYRGLGLYDSAASLLSSARAVSGQRPLDWIQQSYQLGELEFQRGNYVEADRLYAAAEQRYAGSAANDPATEANIALGRGAVAALLAQQERARDFFRRAINIGNTNRLQSVIVESLEHLAQADFQAGDFAAAERSYTSALNARIAYSGETHPRVSKSLNGLAAVAYSRGDSQRAESYWTRALATDRRLLGAKHPDLAPTLNNLGRLRLERRKFTSAIEVLAEALTIKDAQMNKTNSTMVFVLSNLALAHMGRNEFSQSEPLLDRALSVAIQNDHPLRGQLMAYQADVYCHGKRAAEGLQVLIAARSFIVQRYPDDPWRLAYAESVGAGCLTSMARYHEAAGLMQTSLSVVLAKWPADTFYGHDALERAVRLYTLSGNTAKAAEYRKLLAAK